MEHLPCFLLPSDPHVSMPVWPDAWLMLDACLRLACHVHAGHMTEGAEISKEMLKNGQMQFLDLLKEAGGSWLGGDDKKGDGSEEKGSWFGKLTGSGDKSEDKSDDKSADKDSKKKEGGRVILSAAAAAATERQQLVWELQQPAKRGQR